MMTKKKTETTTPMFRQGDVLVAATTETMPAGAKKVARDNGRVVLAYGEVTGHAHAIHGKGVALWQSGDGARYLEVKRACTLQHEEHGSISLDIGMYRVVRQREYVAGELPRMVAD